MASQLNYCKEPKWQGVSGHFSLFFLPIVAKKKIVIIHHEMQECYSKTVAHFLSSLIYDMESEKEKIPKRTKNKKPIC